MLLFPLFVFYDKFNICIFEGTKLNETTNRGLIPGFPHMHVMTVSYTLNFLLFL